MYRVADLTAKTVKRSKNGKKKKEILIARKNGETKHRRAEHT